LHDKVEHDIKTNEAPKNDAKQIPKDRMQQVVEESVHHNKNDLNYLNGVKILGGRLVVDCRSEAMMANWL
jgi:hypothetical protein